MILDVGRCGLVFATRTGASAGTVGGGTRITERDGPTVVVIVGGGGKSRVQLSGYGGGRWFPRFPSCTPGGKRAGPRLGQFLVGVRAGCGRPRTDAGVGVNSAIAEQVPGIVQPGGQFSGVQLLLDQSVLDRTVLFLQLG